MSVKSAIDTGGNKVLAVVIGVPVVIWLGGTQAGTFVNLTLLAVLIGALVTNITLTAQKKARSNAVL